MILHYKLWFINICIEMPFTAWRNKIRYANLKNSENLTDSCQVFFCTIETSR